MRKRILSIMLTICMVLTLVPQTEFAAAGTSSTPSVSAYATKAQLMDGTFAPDSTSGTAANIGKLAFGKNSSRQAQEWYILGKDTDVSGDNTIIFAASPIATGQKFEGALLDDKGDPKKKDVTNLGSDCSYTVTAPTEVYLNHYGASALRGKLQAIATENFTVAEIGMMNATTVTTTDMLQKNLGKNLTYTTTDKLYALHGVKSETKIYAGSSNQTALAMDSYWKDENYFFWLRSPGDGIGDPMFHDSCFALYTHSGSDVKYHGVVAEGAVQPASNLNLSNVLFASAATAATTSNSEVSGKIASGTAMTLRMDGSSKNIGSVLYNTTTGDIKATKGSTERTVSLVVQGNDGTDDWYYSKKITGTETVNTDAIKSALGITSYIDLSSCKIWLEFFNASDNHQSGDGMIYAVNAEKEIEKINTTYATKEQLMNSFRPYGDGSAANVGKLVFGKNSEGKAQEWYILGKDDGISGDNTDNTVIFAASPIVEFKRFSSNTSDAEYDGKDVYANHYGASDLRAALRDMTDDANTLYFSAFEKVMMNSTKVTTKDIKKGTTYTTEDKLYALAAEKDGYQPIKAGSNDNKVLNQATYWGGSGFDFWLRSPDARDSSKALAADPGSLNPGSSIQGETVSSNDNTIRPAGNLKLTNVLFASAAEPSSDGIAAYTIPSDKAMKLRIGGINVGTVSYDVSSGVIVASANFTSSPILFDDKDPTYLVVQGSDGTGDWYFSVRLTVSLFGGYTVSEAQIMDATGAADVELADCKIWIERTSSKTGMTYAVPATKASIPVKTISSVELTGMKPAAGKEFPANASCSTSGVYISASGITYTTVEGTPVTGIADWGKTYRATVTLNAMDLNDRFVFDRNVTATVDGEPLSEYFSPNKDGTLTITKEFTTKSQCITGVTAPTIPTDKTFETYYGYEGNAADPIGSSELGTQATVTIENKKDNTTKPEAMNVIWTIANDNGAAYNKTPGATNTFKWTIPANALADYDVTGCPGYDSASGTITGTVSIKNKAAVPVTITGTDSEIEYTGTDIDVSQYFNIDSNAGTATYSLLTSAEGVTGAGTLNGSNLSVTRTGIFKVKVTTAANGIYAAGEGSITLTVANGTIQYEATGYSGTYDGKEHSISVSVTNPAGTTVTYSTDGETYSNVKPSFTDAGTYTVHYKIEKNNYDKVEGSKTVTIDKRAVNITAQAQSIMWGNSINQNSYDVSEDGIAADDKIAEITLTPSTADLTDDGTISISGVKIENTADRDVTVNYDITLENGALTITHNTSLAPESIDAVKNKTSYKAGNTLNVDDITVTAYYADGYSEKVTDYTTNADDIDMSKTGKKTLTVSYTKNGETKTADITITVTSVYIPLVQKPTVEAGEGVKVTLSTDGTVATITVDDGYELEDVVLNGVSKGKVTEVKGLKTGDKLVVTAEKKPVEPTEPTKEEILAVLADQKLVARSKLVTMKNGKKAVLITWYNRNGEMMDFDGVEIFRSTKRNSGYGKKPIFTSVTGKYYNTAVKKGTKYYYKVRGFVIIDGQKYYTDWSLKAIRTVK
ncbi:MAG: DUF6273 domain-containing protein [Anaerovoracaceae bacterium]